MREHAMDVSIVLGSFHPASLFHEGGALGTRLASYRRDDNRAYCSGGFFKRISKVYHPQGDRIIVLADLSTGCHRFILSSSSKPHYSCFGIPGAALEPRNL